MTRYAPCLLLLLCACSGAYARDIRMHGPNGDGGGSCTDESSAPLASLVPAKAPAPIPRAGKPKAPTALRSGGDDSTGMHAPRWHSFLPGMFR